MKIFVITIQKIYKNLHFKEIMHFIRFQMFSFELKCFGNFCYPLHKMFNIFNLFQYKRNCIMYKHQVTSFYMQLRNRQLYSIPLFHDLTNVLPNRRAKCLLNYKINAIKQNCTSLTPVPCLLKSCMTIYLCNIYKLCFFTNKS